MCARQGGREGGRKGKRERGGEDIAKITFDYKL